MLGVRPGIFRAAGEESELVELTGRVDQLLGADRRAVVQGVSVPAVPEAGILLRERFVQAPGHVKSVRPPGGLGEFVDACVEVLHLESDASEDRHWQPVIGCGERGGETQIVVRVAVSAVVGLPGVGKTVGAELSEGL